MQRHPMTPYHVTAAIVLGTAVLLLWMGRAPICPCGTVRLWHGDPTGPENSQHVADWYTPSHIIHGILFYGLTLALAPRLAVGWRLALATAVEALWEIVENSAAMIERYRTTTVSTEYGGDSVLNSTTDILAMVAGFWLARALPVWASVGLILGFEVLTTWLIRDGLVLNVIMLVWPVEAILEWQAGG